MADELLNFVPVDDDASFGGTKAMAAKPVTKKKIGRRPSSGLRRLPDVTATKTLGFSLLWGAFGAVTGAGVLFGRHLLGRSS